MRRKTEFGICKQEGKLTFEHVPPRAAFNKQTAYKNVPQDEIFESEELIDFNPKGQTLQGGIGYHSLCSRCNGFLGKQYVNPFLEFVRAGSQANQIVGNENNLMSFAKVNPKRFIKQVISMFISMNEPSFTESYPELLEIVKNPESSDLPSRYQIYLYLNDEGDYRYMPISFTNTDGVVCELSFPPFGYVLNIDNDKTLGKLTEITSMKDCPDAELPEIGLKIMKLPTYLWIPLDYKTKEEVREIEKRKKQITTSNRK